MQRSIPFYTERIVPEAVDQGKRILITSHENAIRGILMHLCDIPEEAMTQLHLPNGLPLVRARCPDRVPCVAAEKAPRRGRENRGSRLTFLVCPPSTRYVF